MSPQFPVNVLSPLGPQATQQLMKSLSSDVTIGHIAASLDELCHRQGSPACDKTLGEIVGDGPSFCDTHCPRVMSRAQPHQSFLQNDLEEALGMKQR